MKLALLLCLSSLAPASVRDAAVRRIAQTPAPAVATTLDNLEAALLRSGASTVAGFLALLPAEMRSRFVLLETSRSLQGASRENPRVIVYNNNASTLLAFNGSPEQRGFGVVEAIQLRRETNSYEFRRFVFPESGSVSRVTVEKNPSQCLRCHDENPRPNWEPYNFWPGAIGSSDRLTEGEEQILREFGSSRNPRYARLDRAANLKRVTDDILRFTPAFDLEIQLGYQRVQILGNLLRATPEYRKYKFALLGAISMCPNITSFLPPWKPWATEEALGRYLADTRSRFSTLFAPHLELLSNRHADAGHASAARLRWLLESRGILLPRWGNSLQTPYLIDASLEEVKSLIYDLTRNDGELTTPYPFLLNVVGNAYNFDGGYEPELEPKHQAWCDGLRAKSLARF